MTERAFEQTQVANFASDEAQFAAMINALRGFFMTYEVNS
jgi:hypothetical protein